MSSRAADPRTRPAPRPRALAAMLAPALGAVLLLFGGGLALGAAQSLGFFAAAGSDEVGLGHFRRVLSDPDFFASLGLTLYVALVSSTIAAVLATAAALALNGAAGRSRTLHLLFQIPLTVPHPVVAVAALFLLAPSGLFSRLALRLGLIAEPAQFPLLVNDPWGVGMIAAYVWKEVPFIALMVLAVLRGGASELAQAGRTLGAGPWRCFRHVTLPLILPALGAAGLIVFAYTFGAFEIPYLLGQTHPMLLPVRAYRSYSDVDLLARPEGIATGLVIAALVAAAVALAQTLVQAARRRGAVL